MGKRRWLKWRSLDSLRHSLKKKKQNGKESGEVIRGKEAGFERKELKFREKENNEENLLAA